MSWAENIRIKLKNVKEKRKERQNQKKLKESVRKCLFFPNVNEQLAEPTSIQSLRHTESENKRVNDVNESMQTSTNVTENKSNDPALWENIDDDFR